MRQRACRTNIDPAFETATGGAAGRDDSGPYNRWTVARERLPRDGQADVLWPTRSLLRVGPSTVGERESRHQTWHQATAILTVAMCAVELAGEAANIIVPVSPQGTLAPLDKAMAVLPMAPLDKAMAVLPMAPLDKAMGVLKVPPWPPGPPGLALRTPATLTRRCSARPRPSRWPGRFVACSVHVTLGVLQSGEWQHAAPDPYGVPLPFQTVPGRARVPLSFSPARSQLVNRRRGPRGTAGPTATGGGESLQSAASPPDCSPTDCRCGIFQGG